MTSSSLATSSSSLLREEDWHVDAGVLDVPSILLTGWKFGCYFRFDVIVHAGYKR